MKICEITQFIDNSKIQKLLKKHFDIDGTSTINSQGLVDVVGNVRLKSKLTELPVKFGHVSGDFRCTGNQLKSLAGTPHSVGGYFNCYNNKLTSLTGAPQTVSGYFGCDYNQLESLIGAPQTVDGAFSCIGNPLTSLTGVPASIGGEFWCYYSATLPLMRALVASSIHIFSAPQGFNEVMNRHAGLGKRGMMKCASELLTLGAKLGIDLRANCRW
jgi:hypothetical protein